MSPLRMEGPYELNIETIEANVTRVSPGNYAFGRQNEEGTFLVGYVGRSDTDVKERLRSWVGNIDRPLFKFSYASSPRSAFEKECENYHEFNPPLNESHPDRPENSNWRCPCCGIFG